MSELIDRQTALKAFGLSDKTRKYGGDHSGYDTWMLYEIQDVLEGLPTVEPERKKGHWVPQKGGGVCCSECGEYALDRTDGRYVSVSVMSKFCPNCGADMRGESNG